ncbi:hypothetical protein A2V82_12390 [candidate division KSB1 bacterium RBG_16_48_16]|nr:MAG: hypothetical protein A2V82_12390 [candidate division KSB1 bacterium RBG_16_48_16]
MRYKHIDIAKGIIILLIVFGHSPIIRLIPGLNEILLSFRLPVFFFLAGLFFKHKKSILSTIIDKSDVLLKPFFHTLIVLGFIKIIVQGIDPIHYFAGVIYGNGTTLPATWSPLWFLPHLWAIFVFCRCYIGLTKIEDKPIHLQIILPFTLLVAGYYAIHIFSRVTIELFGRVLIAQGLPFSLDIVFLSSFYFLMGFLLRERAIHFAFRFNLLLLAFSAFVAIHLLLDFSTNFNLRIYDHPVLCTLAAISMIYVVLSVSTLLSRVRLLSAVLTYIGSRSLFLLIFHNAFMWWSLMLLDKLNDRYYLLNAFFALIAGSVLPLLIRDIVKGNSYFSLLLLPLKNNPAFLRMRRVSRFFA